MVSFHSETKLGVAIVVRAMSEDRAWAMWTVADDECVRDLSTLALTGRNDDGNAAVLYVTSSRRDGGDGHLTVETWDRGRVLSEYIHASTDVDRDLDALLAQFRGSSMRAGEVSRRLATCFVRTDGHAYIDVGSLFEWVVSK